MNLTAIRAGLTTNVLTAIDDVTMTGYLMVPAVPPCFEIDFPPDSFVYDQSYGRTSEELRLIVRGIVALGESDEAQVRLDGWLSDGDENVKAAIQADKTLGGACDDLRVERATGHRRLPIPEENTVLLCAEWTVFITTTPT